MAERSVLGAADVDDETLTAMVRDQLGISDAHVVGVEVEVADYDVETLTTAGRYWVRGRARHAGGESPFTFFVKVVQSWTRTDAFRQVPEAAIELAAASLPWRTEPVVYRSDLRSRLPAGLSMPRSYRVIDLDELSAALWLEAVDVHPVPWSRSTFARAAYLLGRLAASPAVRPVGALGVSSVARGYAASRVQHQILPLLEGEELWRHPLVRDAFDVDLRARLLAAADALPALLEELDDAPLGTAHGDACPQNLLVRRSALDGFVLIDFGLWCQAPLGFDLSQLLLGELQLGRRPAAELPDLEAVCLPAYFRGLQQEGCAVGLDLVRRAHAILMFLFWGLTAVPLEVLFGAAPPGSAAVMGERARAAAFVLDLVDATGREPAVPG